MRVAYTPRALADLEEIADYIKARSPQGAARVRTAILDALQTLAQFPRVGRSQTVEAVRKIGVRKYPYLIFYMVDEAAEEIVVLTIRHGSREREYDDA